MDEFGSPLPADKLEKSSVVRHRTEENLEDLRSELKIETGAKLSSAFLAPAGRLFANFSSGIKAARSGTTTCGGRFVKRQTY
jgi:hypothetical protein